MNSTPYNTRANAAGMNGNTANAPVTATNTTGKTYTGAGTGVGTGTGTVAGTGTGTGPATIGSQTTNPLKAAAAAVHGAGEVVRGTINSAVDGAFNESGEVANGQATTSAGIDEIETGNFSAGTKNREGVVPGSDHGVRRGI